MKRYEISHLANYYVLSLFIGDDCMGQRYCATPSRAGKLGKSWINK